ncbi:hypothetical protein Scep_018000 [Stephania cephalantha]|uniref:Protein-L-isoaspartate O-methyltransferase n=1 Tax=Stephania cephalantha TaxID=152367 RepID=A0AAP0IQL4_9MAGN
MVAAIVRSLKHLLTCAHRLQAPPPSSSSSSSSSSRIPRRLTGNSQFFKMENFTYGGGGGGDGGGESDGNKAMVAQLQRYGIIRSAKVAEVMGRIDRGLFATDGSTAYVDSPMQIGYNATISAPHMHAMCLELLEPYLQPGMRALDVGSDGRLGWPECEPYDAIHVGAAAPEIPQPLIDQLKPGGRLVIPVGNIFQDLKVIDKSLDGSISIRSETSVRYVPLTSRDAQLRGH